MFRNCISRSFRVITIIAVLISSVCSKPIDSTDMFKPAVGPFRRLFSLDETAIARLSEIADIRLANPRGCRNEVRRILVPEKPGLDEVHKVWKFSHQVPEKLEFKPRKFHCNPIGDVFIPAVDKKVPAYICKLDDRKFVISSQRFLQDLKSHIEIDVDEATFRRLIVDDGTSLANTVADVIPVTLVQRRGDEFYGVDRGQN